MIQMFLMLATEWITVLVANLWMDKKKFPKVSDND